MVASAPTTLVRCKARPKQHRVVQEIDAKFALRTSSWEKGIIAGASYPSVKETWVRSPVFSNRGGFPLSTKEAYRPHDLLTIKEAAAEFRISERYLKYLRDHRKVRSYVIANKTRFQWLDLHNFLESLADAPVGRKR